MVDAPTLDHLAVASRSAWDNLIRYAYHLGGRWIGGTENYHDPEAHAFYFSQVEFANHTKLELLEPLPVPGSDFLDRFIHRNGPGPHHITFKVPDLDVAIDAVAAAGYSTVNESRDDPRWQEAFLHPKQSHGMVIQLGCEGTEPKGEPWTIPPALPPTAQHGSTIDKLVHLVDDLDAAVGLFAGPLGMAVGDAVETPHWSGVALSNGPWTLELVKPNASAPAAQWMGARSGRLLQVCMSVPDPGSVPDAVRLGRDVMQLHPEVNQGVRVLLRPLRPA